MLDALKRHKILLWALGLLASFLLLGTDRAWARSNVLVIQTDDMSARLLGARYVHRDGTVRSVLPRIQADLMQRGTFFTNMQSATPLCSPSRAALLTGRFSHSSKLITNNGAYGGWPGWQRSSFHNQNLATALQAEGYHTAHFGKFLNNYAAGENAPLEAPPGWDRWVTDATDDSTRDFYGYYLLDASSVSGELRGPMGNRNYAWDQNIDPPSCSFLDPTCNYHTDQMTYLAAQEIKNTDDPFYIQVDYHTPHGDSQPPGGPQPATRHLGTVQKPLFQKPPSWNERDIQDKPTSLRRHMHRISSGQEGAIRYNYKRALESMMSVDEGIGHLLDTLEETGKLDNTFIFFFSDNGYFYGEHRFIRGKYLPHQPSARVPLLVRGPGVLPQKISSPGSSLDITASLLDITGASLPQQEGRSLQNIWSGGKPSRRAILTEFLLSSEFFDTATTSTDISLPETLAPAVPSPPLRYRSILLYPYRYTEYRYGGIELYNLRDDPHETRNLAYRPQHQKRLLDMRRLLREYRECRGEECVLPPTTR